MSYLFLEFERNSNMAYLFIKNAYIEFG